MYCLVISANSPVLTILYELNMAARHDGEHLYSLALRVRHRILESCTPVSSK